MDFLEGDFTFDKLQFVEQKYEAQQVNLNMNQAMQKVKGSHLVKIDLSVDTQPVNMYQPTVTEHIGQITTKIV